MKNILLHIKIFFSSKETKVFLKIFLISFPIVMILLFFFMEMIIISLSSHDKEKIEIQLLKVFNMPHSTNRNLIIEYTDIPEEVQTLPKDHNFWEGDALQYRYTIEQNGIPNS